MQIQSETSLHGLTSYRSTGTEGKLQSLYGHEKDQIRKEIDKWAKEATWESGPKSTAAGN